MPIVNYAEAINELAAEISQTAEEKGFWDIEEVGEIGLIALKLALVHSEVTEALVVHRNDYENEGEQNDILTNMTSIQEDDFVGELADIVIRVLDITGYYDLDIGNAIIGKMEANRSRPYRHGKRY